MTAGLGSRLFLTKSWTAKSFHWEALKPASKWPSNPIHTESLDTAPSSVAQMAEGGYGMAVDFLFFILPPDGTPEGLWRRTGDDFEGCVLRVERLDAELVGRIAIVPDSMSNAGWQVGDLKWRNINHEADGGWRMQDLRKHYDTRKASVFMVDYQEYSLTLGACGHLRLHTGGLPFFPAQRWKRFKAEK
jgi:hypothetical protein